MRTHWVILRVNFVQYYMKLESRVRAPKFLDNFCPPLHIVTRFLTNPLVLSSLTPYTPKTMTSFMDDPVSQIPSLCNGFWYFTICVTSFMEKRMSQLWGVFFLSNEKNIFGFSPLLLLSRCRGLKVSGHWNVRSEALILVPKLHATNRLERKYRKVSEEILLREVRVKQWVS